MSKRTIVYIDGFNLYYGLLRHAPAYKWLDLRKLSQMLVAAENDIVAVKYFTARVNYDPKKPSSKERQEIYLRALQVLGTVEITEGYYQRQDAKMPFPFFTQAHWDLETTMTTFNNNIILRAHLEHSES